MPAACPCPAHAPSLSARPPFRGRSHDTWTAEWTDDEQSENFLHFASPTSCALCMTVRVRQTGTAIVKERDKWTQWTERTLCPFSQ